MAQLYGKKTSDGQPKALECTDEGLLKVDTELTATIDPAGLATQTTLAAVLAKLSADPATQTTLAALLAKIIAAPSTEAKQDTIKTAIDAITTKLIAAPATEASLGNIDTDLGALTDAPASVSVDEDATARSLIALMKGLKNLGIDSVGHQASIAASIACTHDSITLAAANTEYSYAIPANCKKLSFRVVDSTKLVAGSDLRYAWATGKVAAATLPFALLEGGAVFAESNLILTSKTLYVAGITAGDIVLLEMWS